MSQNGIWISILKKDIWRCREKEEESWWRHFSPRPTSDCNGFCQYWALSMSLTIMLTSSSAWWLQWTTAWNNRHSITCRRYMQISPLWNSWIRSCHLLASQFHQSVHCKPCCPINGFKTRFNRLHFESDCLVSLTHGRIWHCPELRFVMTVATGGRVKFVPAV